MSTKRYPRTLAEAFKNPDYAGCIELPDRRVTGYILGGSFPGARRVRPVTITLRQRIARWARRVAIEWRSR